MKYCNKVFYKIIMIFKALILSSLTYLSLACFSNIFGSLPNSDSVISNKNQTTCNIFVNLTVIFQTPLSELSQTTVNMVNSTDCCKQCLNVANCNYFVFNTSSNCCNLYSNTANQVNRFNGVPGLESGFFYFVN